MMPQTIEGKEYLNARETAAFLGVSFVTFQKIRELDDIKEILKPKTFLGRGNAVYYEKGKAQEVKDRFISKPME